MKDKRKLLLMRKFNDDDMVVITKKLERFYYIEEPKNYESSVVRSAIKEVEVVMTNEFRAGLMPAASKLRLIQVAGAGTDRVDIKAAEKSGVIVCNSHSNAIYVAEYGLTMLLTLLKQTHLADLQMRRNLHMVKSFNQEKLMPRLLGGKTVGILGFGEIGQRLATMLMGFDVEILTKRRTRTRLNFVVERVLKVKQVSLRQLLIRSDILIVAAPLSEKTRNLIGDKEIKLMKNSSIIVVLSRPNIVNQDSLFKCLKNNKLAGAALDVWSDKPKIFGEGNGINFEQLEESGRLLVSPHRAGHGAGSPHLDDALENLINFAQNKPLINKVSGEIGY